MPRMLFCASYADYPVPLPVRRKDHETMPTGSTLPLLPGEEILKAFVSSSI